MRILMSYQAAELCTIFVALFFIDLVFSLRMMSDTERYLKPKRVKELHRRIADTGCTLGATLFWAVAKCTGNSSLGLLGFPFVLVGLVLILTRERRSKDVEIGS